MERFDMEKETGYELFRDISIEDLLDKIIYCKSEGKCTRVYMMSGESPLLAISLTKIEELLPRSSFIRVHMTYLINSKFVKRDYFARTSKRLLGESA